MADTNAGSAAPRKQRSWLRLVAWILGIVIVLVVVVYFVGTSSAFFKGVILPKVSKALNAQVTVGDASISPFSQVVLKDLRVQTTGSEALVTVPEVRLRYSLMDIIGGRINVEEATLSSPTIVLVQNPDGTSNLDPILQGSKNQPEKTAKPAAPSKPLQVNVKKVALTDATIRQVKLYKGTNRDVTEISHLNFTIDNLQNGQSAKLAVTADLRMEANPPAPGTNGLLQAKINGNFAIALTPDLKPGSINGNTRLEVGRAEGSLAQATALAATFDCDVTPTDIKQVALRFQKSGTSLGELRVTGPFSVEKTEGRFTVEVLNIDKNLLNIAGASSGLDFGPTKINSTNSIQLKNSGNNIALVGQLTLSTFQLTRTNQTSPPLDLAADYDVSVDRPAGNAMIRALTLTGNQKGKQLIHGELTSPMTVAWGNATNAVGDSALNLSVTHLDLADWKPFVGDFAPAGDVNMKLQLLSQQAGKLLNFELSSDINNLTAGSGSNQITQVAVTLQVKGKATDFKLFDLSDYKFGVARQNQALVSVSGSGTYDKGNEIADFQLKAQLLLAQLLQVLSRPDLKASSGTLDLTMHATQKGKQQNVTGHVSLVDLTAQISNNNFQNFGMSSDFDIGMTPDQVQIRKLTGNLTQAKNPGGAFDVSGAYGLGNKTAQLSARLTDFNQNGLRPFLEPMLADKKLTSVALNGNASVQYDPNAASSVKADLQVTNLVVNDPKGQIPATPLGAKCQLDASLNKQVTDIRQCQLALTPTARATNSISLTGHIDMSQANVTQGNIKIASDSLDLTTYYDLFGGQKKSATAGSAPSTPQTTSTAGTSTTGAADQTKQLPFRNFTVDTSLRRLYLREVDIADFLTSTKIDGGHVVVNPCKLTLNRAPMNATVDLDMGVPGYKYDVGFSAEAVPLAPLVNSFQPERKGQLGGTFTSHAKIAGTGTSGADLQKTLAGQFDLTSTNLNLAIVDVKNPVIKAIVNVVATIPELIKNPEGAVGSLVQNLSGQSKGGVTDEISKAPINTIMARGNAGAGKVNVQQAVIESSAFRAEANGDITLAAELTNSAIRFPVSVSLSQPTARRLNLVPAGTPTNAPYAKLPDFVTEIGTLGNPKAQINKLALLSLAAKGLGGALPLGGTAGNILQSLEALGSSSGTGTNAPNSSPNKPNKLIQGLGTLLEGASPANPGTNANSNPPAHNAGTSQSAQPVNNPQKPKK